MDCFHSKDLGRCPLKLPGGCISRIIAAIALLACFQPVKLAGSDTQIRLTKWVRRHMREVPTSRFIPVCPMPWLAPMPGLPMALAAPMLASQALLDRQQPQVANIAASPCQSARHLPHKLGSKATSTYTNLGLNNCLRYASVLPATFQGTIF